MAGYVIVDNGDGSEEILPAEMDDAEFTGLMPRKQHAWQMRVWSSASPCKQPEKQMGWFRHLVWLITGV